MVALAGIYDKVLAELFGSAGYDRLARGLYVQSEDMAIWRGLWVTFDLKKSLLVVQPSLGVFCPAASKIVDEGLKRAEDDDARGAMGELGYPFVTNLLYACIRSVCEEDRMPYSYDARGANEIKNAAKLVYEDFSKIAHKFFGHISSMHGLRDHILEHPTDSGTGCGIYAIALTYLLDKRITFDDIDDIARISPSPMTEKFAAYIKNKIASQRFDA